MVADKYVRKLFIKIKYYFEKITFLLYALVDRWIQVNKRFFVSYWMLDIWDIYMVCNTSPFLQTLNHTFSKGMRCHRIIFWCRIYSLEHIISSLFHEMSLRNFVATGRCVLYQYPSIFSPFSMLWFLNIELNFTFFLYVLEVVFELIFIDLF